MARYDLHAQWYEDYLHGSAVVHTARVTSLLVSLLGRGSGVCLDVCCGTGVHAPALSALGWRPVGVDVSAGQLGFGARRLPVALGDAVRLPVLSGSVPAAVVVHGHTDVDDYAAVLREVARVLRPGGRFVHVGVHPCFIGAFADWTDRPRLVLTPGYDDTARTHDGWCPSGVRARLGAVHVPLAALLSAVLDAGLRLDAVRESAAPGLYPDLLGLAAVARPSITSG